MRSLVWLAVLFFAGCAVGPEVKTAPGLSGPQRLVSDRLAFGQSIPGGGTVTKAEWERFMREAVAPHFPSGLTVWRAEGQWAGSRGTVREPVMVVEVVHPMGQPSETVFKRIADEYCRRFRQDAVLRTTSPVRSWLYER